MFKMLTSTWMELIWMAEKMKTSFSVQTNSREQSNSVGTKEIVVWGWERIRMYD